MVGGGAPGPPVPAVLSMNGKTDEGVVGMQFQARVSSPEYKI